MGDFAELMRRLGVDITTLANTMRVVFGSPLFQAKLISTTALAGTTTTTVPHGLGRLPGGSCVVRIALAGAVAIDFDELNLTVRTLGAPAADMAITVLVF